MHHRRSVVPSRKNFFSCLRAYSYLGCCENEAAERKFVIRKRKEHGGDLPDEEPAV